MAHLARHGIPCPAPIADLSDRYLRALNGKPAALVTRLPGRSLERPGRRGMRRARRAARAHAPRGALLLRPTSRTRAARSGGASRRARWRRFLDADAEGAARERARVPGAAPLPRPAARPGARATCSATTRCSTTAASRAWSTSTSPASTACCTTSRCAPTTGAWPIRPPTGGSTKSARARCSARYHARAALRRARARRLAGDAARGGAALLAVAAVRLPPAAAGHAGARARPGAFPRDPRAEEAGAACAGPPSMQARIVAARRAARAGSPKAGSCSAPRRSAGSRWCSPTGSS